MNISFNNPWILLILPFALLFVFYFGRRIANKSNKKGWFILTTRSIIIIMLILALSGLNIKTSVDTVSTIFAVDLSESTINNRDEIADFISGSLEYAGESDKVGIITFGQRAEVEIPLIEDLSSFDFQTNPGDEYTNIQKGLVISQALLPDNTNKRIVLITDGNENLGNSVEEGSILKQKNIELKVFDLSRTSTPEVQLQGIDVPKNLHENQSFDVLVKIYSNVKTQAIVTLYSERTIVGEAEVVIEKGTNKFIFKDTADESGFKSYKAAITPTIDTFTENNTYSTYTQIKGKPRILLVDGEGDSAREMEKLLSSIGIDITYMKAQELPRTLVELSKYDSIVMCDVSLEKVNTGFINSIKAYVRDYGGGLVVTGGEDSYALGGYYQTPLEEVLPVNMEMKIKGEVPSLGLMLVIDKSGSMGGDGAFSKIELAKEAAIKALDSLKIKDKIGVIAFDGAAQWVVEIRDIKDKDAIRSDIGTIRAGGGTSIIPALDEAYQALKDEDTKLKHIILLTDGHAESSGYDQLISDIREAGITVSTVAVGDGADQYLLEGLAREGKGRYYFVDEYTSIPEIFSKETFLASKSYINNRTFAPTVRYSHEIINPLLNGVPYLDGYISTSQKDRAETILASDKDEPILAVWQYGLGRSVAWTSDSNGKWTSSYLNSEDGVEFFRNLVEWTLPRISDERLIIETNRVGNEEQIIVKNTQGFDEEYVTKATIISPSNRKEEVELNPEKPGEYMTSFLADEKGVYVIKVNQYKNGEIINTGNFGTAINYSKEYDYSSWFNRLTTLVSKSDGVFITKPEEVFKSRFEDVYGLKDLSRPLIILALLLFLFDIALRRLNIPFHRIVLISKTGQNIIKNISKKEGNINNDNNTISTIKGLAKISNDKRVFRKNRSSKENKINKLDEDSVFKHRHKVNEETNIKEKHEGSKEINKENNKQGNEGNLNTSRLLNIKDRRTGKKRK